MKLKRFLFAILCICSVALCCAQDEKKYYLGVHIGGQVFNGTNDKQMETIDRIAPTFGIQVGKWVKPWLSVNANIDFNQFKGVYSTPKGNKHFTTDTRFGDSEYSFRKQKGMYTTLLGTTMFDLTNLKSGRQSLKHHAIPYVGAGFSPWFKSDESSMIGVLTAGMIYGCRVSESVFMTFDLNNVWVTRNLDNEGCNCFMHYVCGFKVGFLFYL